MSDRAVVLVSGGLDSATVLAIAKHEGYACHALSFNYGQRHGVELDAAQRVARSLGAAEHRIVEVDAAVFGASALTDRRRPVPEAPTAGIPVTYVPARNTVFLALALACAETAAARHLFLGVNAVDYSGYPDCRPAFIEAFERLANLGTQMGVEDRRIQVHAPLIHLTKAEIIHRGIELGVDFTVTVSCYQPNDRGEACGRCDSCRIRRAGFEASGLPDPTRYKTR